MNEPVRGSVADLLSEARDRLSDQSDTPNLDAQLLMMKTLGRPRAWLLAHGEHQLTEPQVQEFERSVSRCEAGTALPYILGWWEFYGRQFHLSSAVLIPRPETELLVEVGLHHLRHAGSGPLRVLEVGCGSGCVIASLALEAPANLYLATDQSAGALEVARRNMEHYGLLSSVGLVQADLATCIQGRLDLICANLPYIPSARVDELAVGKREPRRALDGGPDGMDLLRELVADLSRILARGGLAVLEMAPEQFEAIETLVGESFQGARTERYRDLAGRDRVLAIERPGHEDGKR